MYDFETINKYLLSSKSIMLIIFLQIFSRSFCLIFLFSRCNVLNILTRYTYNTIYFLPFFFFPVFGLASLGVFSPFSTESKNSFNSCSLYVLTG